MACSTGAHVNADLNLRETIAEMGLAIRAGVHAGEVETVPGNIRSLAVHETARIMALAGAGEIFVSNTTRELAAAADVKFDGPWNP